MSKLTDARQRINDVDRKIAALFTERLMAATDIAEYKKERGLKIYDPAREAEVIAKNAALVEDETVRAYYIRFLEETMAVSRAWQDRLMEGMKVAYSGTAGAFAHIAASRLFPTARLLPYPDFESAYRAVEDGGCDAVVLPIENSYNGEVGQVTDLLFSGSLYVNAVTELEITQDLLGVKGATLADIREVLSHPQALGQCAQFIHENGFAEKQYSNTALAAKYVAERGDRSLGAIASAEAARIFGLEVIARGINASRSNTTRFAVLSRTEHRRSAKESGVSSILLFSVRNEAGALAKAIDIIGRHGFNMHVLRSRPMKTLMWQYYFYVEAEGNLHTDEGRAMLEELSRYCDRLKAVGTYTKEASPTV